MKCYTCRRVVIRTVLATAVAFVVQLEPSQAQTSTTDRDDVLRSSEHVVYTETNDVTNAILAFRPTHIPKHSFLPYPYPTLW